jgi:fermentation-respiration switch protein FrsA (DUF1100 family)
VKALLPFVRPLIVALVTAYGVLLVIALFFSNRLIFQPQPAGYRDNPSIIKLKSSDGARISATYMENPAARLTILFSHGNAEDIGDIAPLLEQIRDAGFSVLAYDYQGYGTSQGRPSEQHAYDDEDAAYSYLTETLHVQPNNIMVFGRSVGTGPATYLASRRPVAGLILQSPFMSAFRVMTRVSVLPFDRFNNLQRIKAVHCPVLVIHGTQDTVINIYHGKKLFEAANEPKRFLWVEEANHNDVEVVAGSGYVHVLKAFAILVEQNNASQLR